MVRLPSRPKCVNFSLADRMCLQKLTPHGEEKEESANKVAGDDLDSSRRSNIVLSTEQLFMEKRKEFRAISLEYSHTDLSKATMCWHKSRCVGTGRYGAVYRGIMRDGSEAAIKVMDFEALIEKGERPTRAGFEEEVQMLSKFRHPNLVTLLGWGQHGLCAYLVYELLEGGDVWQRLHKSRKQGAAGRPFMWHERLKVCLDAAMGLTHLHTSKPKAFHRDIKSANILLDRYGVAKMADFGLSCIVADAEAQSVCEKTAVGTPGYRCPIYSRTGRFRECSEVYAFGMVVLELLTGLNPSAHDPNRKGGLIYPVATVLDPQRPGGLERCTQNLDALANWPMDVACDVARLGLCCVDMADETRRPQFVDIVWTLRRIAKCFPKDDTGIDAWAKTARVPQQDMSSPGVKREDVQNALSRVFAPPTRRSPSQNTDENLGQPQSGSQEESVVSTPQMAPDASPNSLMGTEAPFYFEIVAVSRPVKSSLPLQSRLLPLSPPGPISASVAGTGSVVKVPVGRSHQQSFFKAWLPEEHEWRCVSRTALEVSWESGAQGTSTPKLHACAGNPLVLDGALVAPGTTVPLRVGSEVNLVWSGKVLLCLRFWPATHYWQQSKVPLAREATLEGGKA